MTIKTKHSATVSPTNEPERAAVRSIWRLGDYDRFATETVWPVGKVIVQAAGVSRGQRLLDVATGTGNVALRAAEAGADVVALDLTPEHFEAGRRHARELGVELGWVEGDAQALPFEDNEFDTVTSCFGAIFAPDHQRVADEMLRVCKPGGTIAVANLTPDGIAGAFFELFGRFMPPPPPGAQPPVLWGTEDHVRSLFGDRVSGLEMTRRQYVERAASPAAYCTFFKETFGPAVAIEQSLAGQPDRAAAFDRDFLDFATRSNRAAPGSPAEYPYEYLLVVARKRGS
jgi:SAM-dependent methyltransferase